MDASLKPERRVPPPGVNGPGEGYGVVRGHEGEGIFPCVNYAWL